MLVEFFIVKDLNFGIF